MPSLHAARRVAVAALVADAGLDALLVTRLVNVRYLTGLASTNAAVLVVADGAALLATDFRYAQAAREQVDDLEVVEGRDCAGLLLARACALAPGGGVRVGFEADEMTVAAHEALVGAEPAAHLAAAVGIVEQRRAVKDPAEVAAVQRACAVGDAAFAAVLPHLRPGLTERAIARRLEDSMRDHGADDLAFASIVAGGPHGAVPHHVPSAREVQAGEFLTMDFGAQVDGYHSDMTRTVVVGHPVAAWQEDLYTLVRAAQRAGRQALAPGAVLGDVDAAARSVIQAAGFGASFGHGLGHGVGLEIHEPPFFSADADGILPAGSTVTVEPGVYLPGHGGVRIEDTLLVTDEGPRLLTTTTKELLVVG